MHSRRNFYGRIQRLSVPLLMGLVFLSCSSPLLAQEIAPVPLDTAQQVVPVPIAPVPIDTTTRPYVPVERPPVMVQPQPTPATIPETTPAKEKKAPSAVAYAIGFGWSSGKFSFTQKITEEIIDDATATPPTSHDSTYNLTDDFTGMKGIYFHFHVVKPEQKIYFSPNIVYCYEHKTIAGEDRYHRYIFIGGNMGINIAPLLPEKSRLIVEPFIEGGLGLLSLEDGVKGEDSNWHFLMAAMDLMIGGRYWISPDFGVEATFRYINCFLDSGLNSNNPKDEKDYVTFNDYKFGIGIVVRP